MRLENWNRGTEEMSEEKWVESSELAAAGNGEKGIRLYQEDVMC
jgi:hypothetical protein